MAQHQEQEYGPVFAVEDEHVVNGWKQVNPKNKKSISYDQVKVFVKYVFEHSKEELEMDLEEDTDYNEMVVDFLEEKQLGDKQTFTLEDVVDILNWAVDTSDQNEDQQEQLQSLNHHQPQAKNKEQLHKSVQDTKSSQKKESERPESKQSRKQDSHKGQTLSEKQKIQSNLMRISQNQRSQTNNEREQNHLQDENNALHVQEKETPSKRVSRKDSKRQSNTQSIDVDPTMQTQLHDPNEKKNNQIKNHQDQNENQQNYDWGKINKSEQEKHIQLYREINSYQERPRQIQDQQNPSVINDSRVYFKQPLSIKKSLAKLNKSKLHNESKHTVPVLKLDPKAPEVRYLKKHRIILKNKKAKPQYNPQKTGLQELFKFYCGINSDIYSINKHKDPAKGTFDELEKRMTNLYMHNFMLLCKDFNIIETKINSKATVKNSSAVIYRVKENKDGQNLNLNVQIFRKRRNSKGQVPESLGVSINTKEKSLHIQIGQKKKVNSKISKEAGGVKEVWDRDKLSYYFKKEADYTLNVKFDKFMEIMKTVLKDKLVFENKEVQEEKLIQKDLACNTPHESQTINLTLNLRKETSQNSINQEQQDSQEQKLENENQVENQRTEQQNKLQNQELKSSKNIQIDPVIMAICKFFKIDSEKNYEQTFKKLKIQYKIMEPPKSPRLQKKQFKQSNGQFQDDIAEALRVRQQQKQKHRIEVKQKYLNKFTAPEKDIYSSFKSATNHVNNMNSLYGSSPKLITNKAGKYSTVSEGTFGTAEYDMRKKNSGEYKINMGSIIKDARNQIFQGSKENRQTQRIKEHSYTQNLAKSRFNPINSSQNSAKPTLGYKKLHDLRQLKEQEETLSSILLNKSRLMDGANTNRSQKAKQKTKDISSPLLQRMGCHEDDDLLNKYFDQEKQLENSNVRLGTYMR